MMQSRPVFLSGKVVMEDGTPPPDAVTIERVCGGSVRPEGYTDSKGRFSFQLGQNQGMMADASMSSADTDVLESLAEAAPQVWAWAAAAVSASAISRDVNFAPISPASVRKA